MSTATATASAPAIPLTFREVLRIDVIRRIWYAQLVSLFGDFLALFAVIAVVSFRMRAIMVPAQTLMQRETPHDMLGRVASTQISVVFLAQILGLVLSGTLADLFGVRMVFFLCAGLSIALVVAGRLFLRSGATPA